jgi:hypothetical protein
MPRRITPGAMPIMPATIRVSLVVRRDTGRKTVDRMLPDFRFAIGAALAVMVLAVTAFGLFTAVRLTHQTKAGLLESSRGLVFDNRTDWNPFYDSESGRRVGAPARETEATEASAQRAGGGPAGATSPAAAGGEAANATIGSEVAIPAASVAAPAATTAPAVSASVAAAHPDDDPRETGTLPSAAIAAVPTPDPAPTPSAGSEPPAAADRVANAPAATPEIAKAEETPAPSATPPAEAKPAEAVAPARKAAPRPRAVRSTQRQNQSQRSFSQPLGAEQQYWRQQYAPQPQRQNDPLGQPYGSRPNLHWGG